MVEKPFQWLSSVKSDLGHLTRTYNENETQNRILSYEKESNELGKSKRRE